jgi:hypothetical protein
MTATTNHPDAREGRTLRDVRCAGISLIAWVLLPALALSAESKTEKIGPWEIEAVFKGDTFDRCAINRSLRDDIVARFVRSGDGLRLELESPNWKLDRGQHYPVKMTLGAGSFDAEMAAEPNSVSMDVKDKEFQSGLRSAKALTIVAATIKVPLDRSADAFDRLAECVAKNDKSVQTNPFVAPARLP